MAARRRDASSSSNSAWSPSKLAQPGVGQCASANASLSAWSSELVGRRVSKSARKTCICGALAAWLGK
eukprot:4206327-Pyramimonas_sp.AAC.1